MKELRFLLLGLAICLASGVKAQFYDSADDIYFYVRINDDGSLEDDKGWAVVFNFDGLKGAWLLPRNEGVKSVKEKIRSNPNYFEDKVEDTDYNLRYNRSNGAYEIDVEYHPGGISNLFWSGKYSFKFSSDRTYCYLFENGTLSNSIAGESKVSKINYTLKRVDKSFFKVGRSRTPSSTLHE